MLLIYYSRTYIHVNGIKQILCILAMVRRYHHVRSITIITTCSMITQMLHLLRYDRDKLASPANMDFSKVTRVNFAFFQTNEQGDIWGTDVSTRSL